MAHYGTIMDKATEVQEAAADAAVEVLNRYYASVANAGPRGGASQADISEAIAQNAPYPEDPYSIEEIEDVPSKFYWLAFRDPEAIADKKSGVDAAKTKFQYMQVNQVNSMTDEITEGWKGDTAEAFRESFLNPLADSWRIQLMLMDELIIALNHVNTILKSATKDLVETADETITILNGIKEGNGGGSKDLAFTILGAIITVTGAVITGGATAAAFALFAGGTTVANSASNNPEAQPTKHGITGDKVQDVLKSMFTAIDDLEEDTTDKEKKVQKGLKSDLKEVEDHFAVLYADRPGMADGPGDIQPSKEP